MRDTGEVRREHVSVFFGRKGTGKTELARYLWSLFRPWRICIDVKEDLADKLPGVPTVDSPGEIVGLQTVRVVPPHPDDERFYDELFGIAFKHGDVCIWWDELDAATSPNRIPQAAKIYVVRGRSRRCGLLGCTTRPANTHPAFLSQADHVFVHKLRHRLDIDAISRHFDIPPDQLIDALDDLDDFGFLHFDTAAGELESSEPVHDPDALTAELSKLYFGPYQRPTAILDPRD